MSHRATNWAIEQRGLKPATKIVLWYLADCHNRHTSRCDPSQERIAEQCEMSRATVNRHLAELETRGLIRRAKRVDGTTRKQLSTSYELALDFANEGAETTSAASQNETRAVSQNDAEPCLNLDDSRVSKCDTNLGKEPGREPSATPSVAPVCEEFERFWRAYPRPKNRGRTRQLFDQAVKDHGISPAFLARAAKRHAVKKIEKDQTARHFINGSDTWLDQRGWEDYPEEARQVSIETAARFWAEKIEAGAFIPANAISAAVASEMLRLELVDHEMLRRIDRRLVDGRAA